MANPSNPSNPSNPIIFNDGMTMEGLITTSSKRHLINTNNSSAIIGNMMPKTTSEPVRPPTPKPIPRKK